MFLNNANILIAISALEQEQHVEYKSQTFSDFSYASLCAPKCKWKYI